MTEFLTVEKNEKVVGATFLVRFVAMAIDLCLLNIVILLIFLIEGGHTAWLVAREGVPFSNVVPCLLIFILIGPLFFSMIYFTLLHSLGGRTIGKAVMGIRVVAGDGNSPNLGQSFLRWVGYLLSALPLMAGFLWVVLEVNGLSWHDILSKTEVINDKMS